MPRKIESLLLSGPAGRLEALLEEPEDGEPRQAWVVCHPHPMFGGTMHNKVVYRIARGLRHTGAVVLRFNFRGVNLSQGEHAQGIGEIEDARAALAWVRARYPHLPYGLAGFSFGSRVILSLGCEPANPAPARLIAAGFPTRRESRSLPGNCSVPKHFIQSANDEHGPRVELEKIFADIPEPKTLHFIEARDHFFTGALDELEKMVSHVLVLS